MLPRKSGMTAATTGSAGTFVQLLGGLGVHASSPGNSTPTSGQASGLIDRSRRPLRRQAALPRSSDAPHAPPSLDPTAVSMGGFTPLTRRWTFADGAQERLNKSSSCGDIPDMGLFLPAAYAAQQAVETHTQDLKRELQKASLAQELCHSVAQLMVSSWGQGSLKMLSKQEREKALALASEAAKEHLAKFPFRYALSVAARDVLIHMHLIAEACKTGRVAVHAEVDRAARPSPTGNEQWVVTMSCRDRSHLLDAFTRTLSKHVQKIVDADVLTSKDNMALDRFTVECHGPLDTNLLSRTIQALLKDQGQGHKLGDSPLQRDSFLTSSWSRTYSFEMSAGEALATILDADTAPPSTAGHDTPSQSRTADCSAESGSGDVNVGHELEDEEESCMLGGAHMDNQRTPPPRGRRHPHQQQHQEQEQREDGSSQRHDTAVAPSVRLVPYEELTFGPLVAKSSTSETFKVHVNSPNWEGNAVLAAKVLIQQTGQEPKQGSAALKDLWREVDLVSRLDHRNVCKFEGLSQRPDGGWVLLYEFCAGPALDDMLRDSSSSYDFFTIITQLAEAMAYLHGRGILHRDLKPANILLDADGQVKVVDFGLACLAEPRRDMTAETGTYRWMAPEVISHQRYSFACDVYSFGVCMWELLTREQPFSGLTPVQAAFAVAREGKRPLLPRRTPPRLASLIRKCWHQDPDLRLSFEDILALLPQVKESIR